MLLMAYVIYLVLRYSKNCIGSYHSFPNKTYMAVHLNFSSLLQVLISFCINVLNRKSKKEIKKKNIVMA